MTYFYVSKIGGGKPTFRHPSYESAIKEAERLIEAIGGEYEILEVRAIVKAAPKYVVQDFQEVDHINHDTLDNRKENLRICGRVENCQNKGKHKDNTTGFKGAYFDKRRGTFYSHIGVNGKIKWVGGGYKTAEEAHDAYLRVAKVLHGEFLFEENILDDKKEREVSSVCS